MTTILSIQSSVASGHVGNSAATFPLMRRGHQVFPVLTVHFSNHTGYGSWQGPALAPTDVLSVVQGIDDLGKLNQVDAVLSVYQGAEEMGEAILSAVALVKERNPKAFYACDPVMGDDGRGIYVRPGIPEFMASTVVPAADVVTPNRFELGYLTGTNPQSIDEVVAAARQLIKRGPQIVLVTSVPDPSKPKSMFMTAVTPDQAWLVETPLIDRSFTGSGDVTAAIFTSELASGADPASALSTTASVLNGLLTQTAELGSAELALVEAQDQLAQPSEVFSVSEVN